LAGKCCVYLRRPRFYLVPVLYSVIWTMRIKLTSKRIYLKLYYKSRILSTNQPHSTMRSCKKIAWSFTTEEQWTQYLVRDCFLSLTRLISNRLSNNSQNYLQDLGEGEWEKLKSRNPVWNDVDLRDNRYDQIIHLVNFNYEKNGQRVFLILEIYPLCLFKK